MITKRCAAVGLLAAASLFEAQWVLGQDAETSNNPGGGWRRLGDSAQTQNPQPYPNVQNQYPNNPNPNAPPPPAASGPNSDGRYNPGYNQAPNFPPLPDQLTIPAGTYFTIRLNQTLSTNHNQPGDAFTAQLVKPIVVDGTVVADRGQTVAGRVAEVDRGGQVKGVSRLGIELTELSLVDGQQVPLRTQLISHTAPSSAGRDAAAVGTTSAIGAMIGAVAGWGTGAAIGAGAGAAAGLAGVLLTRGYPTVIYPESVLTFRIEQPITFSTTRAPYAFRPVSPNDYNQPSDQPHLYTRGPEAPRPYPYYGPAYDPYYGPYYGPGWYGYPYGPYFYGPSFGVVISRGGYYHGGYHGWRR